MITATTLDSYQTPPPLQLADNLYILIIEDNAGDVFIMEEALHENKIRFVAKVLSDGDQASSFFDRIDDDAAAPCPDIVLLDLNLPKQSGHWVLSRIRASLRCPCVPIVIVSSSQAPADMEQIRQRGATSYFRKPGNLEEFLRLGALVNSLLENSPHQ